MNWEILSMTAAAFELLAIYLLGKHNRLGFVSNMVGGSMWIAYSIITRSAFGLIMVCGVAFILNIKGFRQWSMGRKST